MGTTAWLYDVAGPEWQPVDTETAARAIYITSDDEQGALADRMRAGLRSGDFRMFVNSDGQVVIGSDADLAELIAKVEQRGFWDGGEDE